MVVFLEANSRLYSQLCLCLFLPSFPRPGLDVHASLLLRGEDAGGLDHGGRAGLGPRDGGGVALVEHPAREGEERQRLADGANPNRSRNDF